MIGYSQRFQDELREELLVIIERLIQVQVEYNNTFETFVNTKVIGCFADGYYKGINKFKDQLDAHNVCLLNNMYVQINKCREL